jgi:hypothetical protein
MRRPLGVELGAEDKSLARRWAIALPSFYSSILVIAMIVAALASSTADKATVVASSESKNLLLDHSSTRPYRPLPYRSLPTMVAAWSVTKS